MRGNNKGRIFMSLINHILCLFARCLHPSCLASLPPPHFKSHSLYRFTDPSEKRRESREIGIEKKEDKVFLFIYFFGCVSIMLFYDGLCWLTCSHKEQNLHCGPSKSPFTSVQRPKTIWTKSLSTEVRNVGIIVNNCKPDPLDSLLHRTI